MVAVSGLSGLRNAYRSVLSAVGSSEISGASRWLDALLVLGARRPTKTASRAAAAATRRIGAYLFIALLPLSRRRPGSLSRVVHVAVVAPHSPAPEKRFGPRAGSSRQTKYASRAARRAANGTERRRHSRLSDLE